MPAPSQTPAIARRAKRYAALLPLLYLAYMLSFADRVIFGLVVRPIKAALELGDAQVGLLAGLAFSASYAVFSPLGGWLVDRWPRPPVFAGAVGFWSLATALTGLASSFLAMAMARIGVGAGEAVLHPLSVSLLADSRAPSTRARGFSIYLSAGALGALMALLLGGLAMLHAGAASHHAGGEGWRQLFFLAALPGLFLAGAVLVLMRDPPRGDARLQQAPRAGALVFMRAHPGVSLALFLGVSLVQMGPYTQTLWGVTFFQRAYGWDAGRAAITLGLTAGVASLIGCLGVAPLLNLLRARGVRRAPLLVGMAAASWYAVLSVAGLLAQSGAAAAGLLGAAALAGYVPTVCAFTAMGEVLPPAARARLAGVHTLANGVISNSLGPFLVGWLSERVFNVAGGVRFALACTIAMGAASGVAAIAAGLKSYGCLSAAADAAD
jgi:MFS family permease